MSNKKILKKQQLYFNYFCELAVYWDGLAIKLNKTGLNCGYQSRLAYHYTRCANRMAERIEDTERVIRLQPIDSAGQNPAIIKDPIKKH